MKVLNYTERQDGLILLGRHPLALSAPIMATSSRKKPAFLVLAHSDPAGLYRLLSRIAPHARVFVHLDRKAKIEDYARCRASDNVHFVENRVDVKWGGFSMVEATINLIQAALSSGQDFSHLVLISGSCYPIAPIEETVEQLGNEPERNYIKYIDMRESPDHYMKSVERFHFFDFFDSRKGSSFNRIVRALLQKAFSPIKRKVPEGLVPYFGSQWWALSHACCSYILDKYEKDAQLRAFWRFTLAPDEHFFHTIVGNSPFAETCDGLQPFTGRGTYKLANLHLIDASLAKVFTEADFDEIRNSDKLFVRKVSSTDSKPLLDRIDREILGVT